MSLKNATIGLIAREAGCSPSTVSRVISGYNKGFSVRPELEAKILSLAEDFDYKPNPYWRSLRTSKTKLIAIFDQLACGDGVVQNAKREFILKIREAGYTESGKYVDQKIPESFSLSFPVDGALFFDIADGVCLNFVEDRQIPYVVVNGRCRPNGSAIVADEEADVRKLFDCLHAGGHRRIAYYAGHEQAISIGGIHYSEVARETFYLENIDRLGLVCASAHWKREIPPQEFLQRSFHIEKMTAVICYDHIKAVKLMQAAHEMGIRIPEDLSICCFNDEYPLEYLTPPVSCIATPGNRMGELAAELLLETFEGRHQNKGEIIPIQGELIERQSIRDLNLSTPDRISR